MNLTWALPRQGNLPNAPQLARPSTVTVYPDETQSRPALYGPKGEPLYKERPPFGFARHVEDGR